MRKWAKGTACAALLTASFVALGAGPAFADVTSGDNSLLGGNQVNAPVSIPVDASGNAVAVGGEAFALSKGGSSVENGRGGGGSQQTSGNGSILGGNQVTAPISAPVNVCGNALAVFGAAGAGCKGSAKVKNGGGGDQQTSGNDSIGGGNQVTAPISAPVNVCGNAAAILGEAVAGCKGGAKVKNGGGGYHGGGQQTSGNDSIGGGNQVTAPISAPVNACGNAGAVLGDAAAGCAGTLHGYGHDEQSHYAAPMTKASANQPLTGLDNGSLYALALGALLAAASATKTIARRVRMRRR